MLKGFRDFMMRGNVVDMAVGVVIGAAFTAVVTGFVTAFLTPLVGVVVGAAGDFANYKATVGGVVFPYGQFLNVLIAFVLTAAVLYFCVVLPVVYPLLKMPGFEKLAIRGQLPVVHDDAMTVRKLCAESL